jgi:hypothetical protein
VSGDPGFTVQTDDLQTQGSKYSAVADAVRTAHQKLVDTLNSVGACWGSDEVGKQIEKSYVAPAMKSLDALDQVDGGVQGMADASRTWAQNYQNVQSA